MKAWVYIALGSNLGDSLQILREAVRRIACWSEVPVQTSSVWTSSPVDCPPGSPEFLNAVLRCQPFARETPESLLQKLQELERAFGRRPKRILNEPRPLDLDLIHWEGETRQSVPLTLPHPRAHLRRFVVEPMAELDPDLVLPGQSQSLAHLRSSLERGPEQLNRLPDVCLRTSPSNAP